MRKIHNGLIFTVLLALLVSLFAVNLPFASATNPYGEYLGNKSPYPYEKTTYKPVPKGYNLAFIHYVGRHGSRHLSSAKYDLTLFELLSIAEKDGQITKLGLELKNDIEKLMAIEKGKYGNLTKLGKNELRKIGERTGANYKQLFATGRSIEAYATYEGRAQESRDEFLAGLSANLKGNKVNSAFYPKNQDPYLRPYDIATKYKEFEDKGEWQALVEKYGEDEIGKKHSERVLSTLFSVAFYNRLAAGEFKIKDASGKVNLKNPLDAASNLFQLYVISPSLSEDGSKFDFKKYFTNEEMSWFSSVLNMEDYFAKGPSLTTTDIPVNISAPLVKYMIASSEKALKNKDSAGIFSFAHGETIMPLAAFLEIKGACQSTDDPYQVAKIWDGAVVSPMGSTIMWLFYSNGKDVLVKMLHNEKEIAFPIKTATYPYYKWSDVKAYYTKKIETLGITLDSTLEQNIQALKEKF